MNRNPNKSKSGVTLIEALVAFSIFAFAASILTPMLLQARDKTRLAACANNLRELGQAVQDHEQSLGYLPSSGWGWRWTGDPDAGFGKNQPGGWLFDVVRFTKYSDVVNKDAGLSYPAKTEKMLVTHATPIPLFYCPDRRPVKVYPFSRNDSLANNLYACREGSCQVVRTDYQANSGNIAAGETSGPADFRQDPPNAYSPNWNGITFHVSALRRAQIEDGLSKTMCIGEKYLNPEHYLDGQDSADFLSAYCGIDRDVNGYTASATKSTPPQVIESFLPRRDKYGLSLNWTFGSAHESGFNIVNCDNSVRFISYKIDFVAFFRMCGRNDGPGTLAQ